MMKGLKKTRMALVAAAFAMVGLGAGNAQAYPMYDDVASSNDCHSCHPEFESVGSLHNSHLINFGIQAGGPITNRCNVCHTNGGGTTPVYTFGSNGGGGGGGFGCAGCHGQDYGETATTAPYAGKPKASGWGLRRVHQAAGVTVCQGCHGTGPVTVLDETSKPPYYPMHVSSVLRDSCSAAQEDLPFDVDSKGLDNDGNGVADYVSDANCVLPSTTTTTVTTTTTTTLPVNCGASPDLTCTAGAKTKLLISEKAPGKEKVKFLVSKLVPAVLKADFGAPVTSDTSYALCVYNASNALVGSYEVARGSENCGTAPCWSDFKDAGYAYADKDLLTADGVSKIQLAGGDAGKGKVMLQASNKASTMPTGVAAMLNGATSATAQLVTSDGDCFGMALSTVKKADGVLFSASAP